MAIGRTISRRTVLAAGAFLALASQVPLAAAQEEPFVVGVVGSMTGVSASFDRSVVDGVSASIQYWNDNGGFNGRPVTLQILDDESQPATAVTVYRRLTDDPAVNVVIAASPASSLIAIKSVADEFGVPTAGSATAEALANPPARYFFRTLPSSDDYMIAMMNWVAEQGYQSIATLNPTDVTGQREAQVVRELAADLGIQVVAQESYNPTDTNFTAQLVNIRNARPDFFYDGAIGASTVQIFRQIQQLNLTMPLALHSATFNEGFYNGIGGAELAEGVFTPIERGGLGGDTEGLSAELYQAASTILGAPATNLNTAGFDTGLIVMAAVNASDGTREGILAAMEGLTDLQTIGGLVNYSPESRAGKDYRSIAMGQLVDGEFVFAQ